MTIFMQSALVQPTIKHRTQRKLNPCYSISGISRRTKCFPYMSKYFPTEFSRRDLLTGLDIDMIALNQINVLAEKFSRTNRRRTSDVPDSKTMRPKILDKVRDLEGKHFVEIWRKRFSDSSLQRDFKCNHHTWEFPRQTQVKVLILPVHLPKRYR